MKWVGNKCRKRKEGDKSAKGINEWKVRKKLFPEKVNLSVS
jgi:hypothetical protein